MIVGRHKHKHRVMRTRAIHIRTSLCNISNTSDSVSSGYPNTEKRVENTTRREVFLTKFVVWIADETLSRVCDISSQSLSVWGRTDIGQHLSSAHSKEQRLGTRVTNLEIVTEIYPFYTTSRQPGVGVEISSFLMAKFPIVWNTNMAAKWRGMIFVPRASAATF